MRPFETAPASSAARDACSRRQVVALATIVAAGFGLRLAYLAHAVRTRGFVWEDPDRYMRQALKLAGNGDGWHWTFDAVTYSINAQQHALPPMYSVFLSFFALFPGFPLSAQVAQVVLGTIAILLVFELGRLMHSRAAGLVSAAAYALWVPSIFNVWSTSQETLYLPLILLAFVVLCRAMLARSLVSFGLAGLVFGVAALTRSMPMFFVLPAAALYVVIATDRRRGAREALTLIAGVLLVVVPYSAALSQYFGQLTIIDTHGSIHLQAEAGARAPGLIETVAAIVREILVRPLGYAAGAFTLARSLLHVNGGRILQIYVVAPSELQAVLWKVVVHAGTDMLLIVSTALAGVGAVLCRRPQIASLFLLWAAVNVGVASLGGFGGARLRVPFEPLLMILAAVCLTGSWHRRGTAKLLAGAALGLLAAIAVLPQVPRSLRAWPDYGVEWPSIFSRGAGTFEGRAGFSVPVGADRIGAFALASGESASPVRIQVRVEGVLVRTVEIAPGETQSVRIIARRPGPEFVELETDESRSPPSPVRLVVPGR